MKRPTPAEQFRREQSKQNLITFVRFLPWVAFVAVLIIYVGPALRKHDAEWERLPVQTAVGQVKRIHAPTPDDHPGPGHAALTAITLVWNTPRGHVKGEAHTNGVVAMGQQFRVQYRQHPSGDVRIVRLAPVDAAHHGRR